MEFLYFLQKTLPILFWVLIIFGFDTTYVAILTISAAIIHEIGHIIAIVFLCKKEKTLCGDISGFRIKTENLSYKEEIIVSLAGPSINLITAILFLLLPFPQGFKEYAYTFAILNFMTMASNLLPIENYDGYNALLAAFSLMFKECTRGERILQNLSFLFSAILCFFSLYLMLKIGEGYWIFALFFSLTLSRIIKQQKTYNLRE